MNKSLQNIQNILEQNKNLGADIKQLFMEALEQADKELEIISFKLEKTEQVKKTTAILLEETIEELEQKRAAVEAQNRELEIEAALERVRAIAMAMHHTEDLSSTVGIFFKQLKILGIIPIRCGVGQIDGATRTTNLTTTTSSKLGDSFEVIGKVKQTGHPVLDGIFENWKLQKEYHPVLKGDDIKAYYSIMNRQIDYPEYSEDITQYGNIFYFREGFVFAWTENELSEEDLKIFRRFTSVLSLTYRRYLDLKEAEAQAREAQIEAALERVRSKAMAMNSTENIALIVDTFFSELKKLNIRPHRCGVGMVDEETRIADIHATTMNHNNEVITMKGNLKLAGHPVLDSVFENWKLQKEYHPVLYGKEIIEYYRFMNPQIIFPDFAEDEVQYGYYFNFKEGGVFAWTDSELSEEDLQIFRRYTSVLSLTYRRYMDLKEAEAQAREAQIEAALERVRTIAMSMHESDDLTKAVATVFTELRHLGLNTVRCGIGIMQGKNKMVDVWTTSSSDKENSIHVSGDEKLEGHPLLDKIYSGWQNQKDISYLLQGEDLHNYYDITSKSNLKVPAPILKDKPVANIKQYYHCIMFPAGGLFAFSEEELSEDAKKLMRRFTDVFHLAFTRHLDLKQAEEQNKIIQTENERKTQELEEARELQLAMLPTELPDIPALDIAVYMQTATEVGGDYYDFSIREDGSLNIAIGDATGHGMKAGIMVSSMKSIFTTNSPKMDLESFFITANSGVKSMGLKRMMMGFSMLNINKKKLQFINAGMPPIFMFHKKSNVVEELKEHGLPIGAMNHSRYSITSRTLEKGDVLLMLTDGMPELHNDKHEIYGYDRIKELLGKVNGYKSEKIITQLKEETSAWLNGQNPDDDVTFVVIKVI